MHIGHSLNEAWCGEYGVPLIKALTYIFPGEVLRPACVEASPWDGGIVSFEGCGGGPVCETAFGVSIQTEGKERLYVEKRRREWCEHWVERQGRDCRHAAFESYNGKNLCGQHAIMRGFEVPTSERKVLGRPRFPELYLAMAWLMSRRSTCARLQVGCVIVSTDFRRVLGMGYNGNASGRANCCDSTEPGKCGCIHAEQNAIINCHGSKNEGKVVCCTHLPCVVCAKFIVNLGGVGAVHYQEQYRSSDGQVVLEDAGIRCRKFTSGKGREDG